MMLMMMVPLDLLAMHSFMVMCIDLCAPLFCAIFFCLSLPRMNMMDAAAAYDDDDVITRSRMRWKRMMLLMLLMLL